MCDMTQSYDSFVGVSWLVCQSDVTHSCVWRVAFVFVTCLIHICGMMHCYVSHGTFVCVTWRMRLFGVCVCVCVCDAFISYVRRDASICVTWRIRTCFIMHLCVWRDAFVCVTWLRRMCDMIPSFVRRDVFVLLTWRIHIYDMAHSNLWYRLIHMYDMMHLYVWRAFVRVKARGGGLGSRPKKCTGRDWGMGSSTI